MLLDLSVLTRRRTLPFSKALQLWHLHDKADRLNVHERNMVGGCAASPWKKARSAKRCQPERLLFEQPIHDNTFAGFEVRTAVKLFCACKAFSMQSTALQRQLEAYGCSPGA